MLPRRVFCDRCRKMIAPQIEGRQESYPVRGMNIGIEARVAVCPECGSDIFHEELDSLNMERAYEKYRKMRGALSPAEITSVRHRYGLAQRSFSRLLGFGDITIHRYESGAIPDHAHNVVLTMVRDDPEKVTMLLEKHGTRLPEPEREKLRRRLSELREEQHETRIVEFRNHIFDSPPSIENGYRRFSWEKIAATVQVLGHKDRQLWKTKLMKLLWYADFRHFREFSVSITGLRYARAPHGLVPDKYDFLLAFLQDEGLIDIEAREAAASAGEIIVPTYTCKPEEVLDPDESETIDVVVDKFASWTASRLSEYCHREAAWQELANGRVVPYSYAERVNI